jgi:hypothetical protein
MNTADRALRLKLVEPLPPAHVSIGEVFSTTVPVVTTRVVACDLDLIFDARFLKETSGRPQHQHLQGKDRVSQELSWRFQGKKITRQTFISIEGRGEGLFQKIEFPLEVTQ